MPPFYIAQFLARSPHLCYRPKSSHPLSSGRSALIIQCDHCNTSYEYDEERFERKPSKKIRCARCKKVFEIQNPAFQERPLAKVSGLDETGIRNLPEWEQKDEKSTAPHAPASDVTGRGDVSLSLPRDKRLSVAIIEGPEAAKVFRIEKPRTILGRSNTDIVLNDSESSREHAAIEVRGTAIFLQDLDSKNGTWVGGKRIEGRVEIQNQTEFQIGATTLMLIVTEAE